MIEHKTLIKQKLLEKTDKKADLHQFYNFFSLVKLIKKKMADHWKMVSIIVLKLNLKKNSQI